MIGTVITAAHKAKAVRLGKKLAKHTADRSATVDECKALAIELHAAGMTEVELAALFKVDRARTIRRWLGKMTD
jgi:hypothetical protein